MRRRLVFALISLTGWATAGPAISQEPPPLVSTVRIVETVPGSVAMGCSTPPSITDASITLGRDGDLQAPLTIDYTVGDFRGSTPGSVTFGAGQDAVTVSVATGADDYFLHFSFALVDGAGYDLGEPANVSVDGLYSTPSCPLPPTTEPPTGTRELPRTGSSEGLDVLALAGVMLLLAGFGLNRSATARRRATGPTT